MGTLEYDGVAVEFDDRLLAHLELVMVQKMRRQEKLMASANSPTGLFATDVEGDAAHPASGTRFV
jgi:hypothetical protein